MKSKKKRHNIRCDNGRSRKNMFIWLAVKYKTVFKCINKNGYHTSVNVNRCIKSGWEKIKRDLMDANPTKMSWKLSVFYQLQLCLHIAQMWLTINLIHWIDFTFDSFSFDFFRRVASNALNHPWRYVARLFCSWINRFKCGIFMPHRRTDILLSPLIPTLRNTNTELSLLPVFEKVF